MTGVAQPAEATPPVYFELPVNNDRAAIIANIAANQPRHLPELRQHEWTERPVCIVAGGPSLDDYLPMLRALRPDSDVLSINGAYKHLRSIGIESDHFVMIDSREGNIVHVDQPYTGTTHYLATQVHPKVFDALDTFRVTKFNLGTQAAHDAHKALGLKEITQVAGPIGMASVYAISVAAALGYKNMFLFGYDFSRRDDKAYAFDQPMNAADGEIEITVSGRTFKTTLALARTAQQFAFAISPLIGGVEKFQGVQLNIRLLSDGLLSAILAAEDDRRETEVKEREKYEAMWQQPQYRTVAPALEYVHQALDLLRPPIGASIADYGCGTGRATKFFLDLGFDAEGVDIAENCLEESVPFVQAALWDVAKLPQVDYGFSCDVLEHIPTDRVRETLAAIHATTRVACYLNIDTIPDSMGVAIGQTLHMTVMPAAEWEKVLRAFWPIVEVHHADERQAIFVCRKEP